MPIQHWLCQKVTLGWPEAQGTHTALTWPGLVSALTLCTSCHDMWLSVQESLLCTLAHCTTQRYYNELLVMSEAFQQDHPSQRMKVFTEHFFKNYSLQSEQRNRKALQNN